MDSYEIDKYLTWRYSKEKGGFKLSIVEEMDKLQKRINAMDFLEEARVCQDWGGADVIIASQMKKDILDWQNSKPDTISYRKTAPRRRAVITEYSRELSWLFYKLKDIFVGRIDYASKYDFYGTLAQAALDYIEIKKSNANCQELLLAVLDSASKWQQNDTE